MAQDSFELFRVYSSSPIDLYPPMTCISLVSLPELVFPAVASTSEDTKSKRPKRRRSADRNELNFQEFLHCGSDSSSEKIRVWRNEKNVRFYDCSCESRKPTHDLKKIKMHLKKIHGLEIQEMTTS
jgi:hypothetical protein